MPTHEFLFCDSVDDMFKGRGHIILWYNYEKGNPNNSHWIILLRNIDHDKPYVYFFDSCGIDNIFTKDKELREHIIRVCKRDKYKLYVNDQKFQSDNSMVCGRYCLFVYALNKYNISPPEIEKILEKLTEKNLIKIVS
jgi:hypothetical protein